MPKWSDITGFKRPWLIALALAAIIVAAVAVRHYSARGVATITPTRGDAAQVVYATGVVEPRVWAKVSALQRKRIVEMCDCEGKSVFKGEVLARLDDGAERAALIELEARRDRFKDDVERLSTLVARNVASRTSLEEKETQLAEYEARITAQKERIADLVLRAPMTGVVLRKDGQVGEIAGTTSSDVLFWVGQPKPLRVAAEVNEEDIARVKNGQTVLIRHEGFTSVQLTATVDEITPKGDPSTKTFRVYFALPDDSPLKIGMSVEANIVVREAKNVLLLPAAALGNDSVLTVVDGRILRKEVKTGIRGTRMIEISTGLDGSEDVVAVYTADLAAGTRVKPVRTQQK